MFSQPFFESLVELNQLDPYRNQDNDKYFDTFIVRYDEIPYDDMYKLFKNLFLPSVVLTLFKNTYSLINYIEANTLQKEKIFKLKKDPLKYLTPIINGLQKRLLLAQAEGNKSECQKLEFAIKIHQQFLKDSLGVLHLFQKAEIFLYRNRKKIHKLEHLTISTEKLKEAKKKVDYYKQISEIGKFYEGYEFFSKTYQKKLWHSTAIKIYKLCKLLTPNLIDNVLKERIEYLFTQANIQITLNTTRLNKAKLFTIINKIPIWLYETESKKTNLSLEIQNEKLTLHFQKEKVNFKEENNPYPKFFENSPNSLFLLS